MLHITKTVTKHKFTLYYCTNTTMKVLLLQ